MQDAKPRAIPMDTNLKLSRKDEPKCNEQEKKQYHEMMGIVGWKTAWTGPGLAFAHFVFSRFFISPAFKCCEKGFTLPEIYAIQRYCLSP